MPSLGFPLPTDGTRDATIDWISGCNGIRVFKEDVLCDVVDALLIAMWSHTRGEPYTEKPRRYEDLVMTIWKHPEAPFAGTVRAKPNFTSTMKRVQLMHADVIDLSECRPHSAHTIRCPLCPYFSGPKKMKIHLRGHKKNHQL